MDLVPESDPSFAIETMSETNKIGCKSKRDPESLFKNGSKSGSHMILTRNYSFWNPNPNHIQLVLHENKMAVFLILFHRGNQVDSLFVGNVGPDGQATIYLSAFFSLLGKRLVTHLGVVKGGTNPSPIRAQPALGRA